MAPRTCHCQHRLRTRLVLLGGAQVGALTKSLFIPGTGRAASVTVDGDALLWDSVELPEVPTSDR